jgi:deoxyxylulose-5-phosphate synthase
MRDSRATGCCKGKGGSMHIADGSVGYLGANGVLTSGCVLAPGVGQSIKMRGTDQVAVTVFGDGAANRGPFHGGVNLAALWTLPVVFVCENSFWASTTAHDLSTAGGSIAARAAGYGIPGATVDGNDALAVYDAMESVTGEVPETEILVPLGLAHVKRSGTDVTVIATARMVGESLAAADRLAGEGISVEVVDPRSLVPLDREGLAASVRKTHRVVIAEEGPIRGSVGAWLAWVIMEDCFDDLDAPIARVAGPNIPIPFSPPLEAFATPGAADVVDAVRRSVK